jgi:hypothetical protein
MLVHSPRATSVSKRLSLASSVFEFRRVGEADEIDFPRRRSVRDISQGNPTCAHKAHTGIVRSVPRLGPRSIYLQQTPTMLSVLQTLSSASAGNPLCLRLAAGRGSFPDRRRTAERTCSHQRRGGSLPDVRITSIFRLTSELDPSQGNTPRIRRPTRDPR